MIVKVSFLEVIAVCFVPYSNTYFGAIDSAPLELVSHLVYLLLDGMCFILCHWLNCDIPFMLKFAFVFLIEYYFFQLLTEAKMAKIVGKIDLCFTDFHFFGYYYFQRMEKCFLTEKPFAIGSVKTVSMMWCLKFISGLSIFQLLFMYNYNNYNDNYYYY